MNNTYDGVYCSICDKKYIKFEDFGSPNRKNVLCVVCRSLERHRLLWMFWKEKTNLFSSHAPLRVLHFAPESRFHMIFSQMEMLDYYACDLNIEKYQEWKVGTVTYADITDIPFENDFFDVILCNHVLEHIPDDHKAMSELNRVLKPGGWATLQVPLKTSLDKTYEDFSIQTPEGREKAFGRYDHVRWYGKDYSVKLTKAGFVVDENKFIEQFTEKEMIYNGLAKELIYVCSKT